MADKEYFGFIWDEDKNKINKKKHNLSFEIAVRIFNDPFLYFEYDEENSTEQEDRYDYIGALNIGSRMVLYVVATDRQNKRRIISARKATKKETKIYEQNAKSIQLH